MSNSTYILDDTLLVSSSQRFFNYLLDTICILALLFVIGFCLGVIASLFGLNGILEWFENIGDLEGRLIFIVFSFLYYLLTESLSGRSIAKFITGTIVVDENGIKPPLSAIFKRSLCRIIPFDALSFLRSRSGWHDSMSDTYVVYKKELEDEVRIFNELKSIGVQETNF